MCVDEACECYSWPYPWFNLRVSALAPSSEVFAEVLCSGDYPRCLAELEEVPLSSLWPGSRTLRALASLLTAEDPQVNKAAADYLSSGASNKHFRTRVSNAQEKTVGAPFLLFEPHF